MTLQEVCDVSVVIPVRDEEGRIDELWSRLSAALTGTGLLWEAVFVDDGSRDRTLEMLKARAQKDARLKIAVLSRNFGHQPALTAGLRRARGRAVVMMDGDLQDPPEVLPALVRSWQSGAQVVRAVRRRRAEKGLRRLMTAAFYRLMRFSGGFDLGVDSGIFSLMDRKALEVLKSLDERNRYLPGLRAWAGFRQADVPYDRAERAGGDSKQSFLRLLQYAANAVFSFSYIPLRVASFAGALVCALGVGYSVFLVAARLLRFNVVPGFTTTAVAVMVLGGIQLLCLGIIGEYLARIYEETKRRPLFVEDEFIDLSPGR